LFSYFVLDESDEDSMESSNVADGQNIDDDDNFLYHHKPSSGCSESNVLKSLAIATADKENTTENHCGSVLSTNNSTPSRHQQVNICKNFTFILL
jgi:hypothetical protein